MKFKGFIVELLESTLLSIAVISIIYAFVAFPTEIQGQSMVPTFYHGERILVEKITTKFKDYKRGEIVVVESPKENIDLIKRVIALPGDIIKVKECGVYISNSDGRHKLSESYISDGVCTSAGAFLLEGKSIRVPEKNYFVMGDNREFSSDSRSFGFIEDKKIVGRVILRFWPLDRLGFVNN